MDTEIKLQIANLSCIRQQKTIFTDISFQLNAGEALFIEGPNGSGKSSLLRLLAGISTPSSGEILWCGKSIQQTHAEYCDHLHYVGHLNGIKLGLTVVENLQLAQHLTLTKSLVEFESVLLRLQLASHKNIQARYLSAGQKRRIALAKLFLISKPLWLLDEPFTALDIDTQAIFLLQLEQHLQNGGIALISSHHPISIKNNPAQTLRLASC